MKSLKENAYDIIRLYINQLGIMIFSLLLYFAIDPFGDEALAKSLNIFISVFSVCFYLVLIYYVIWDIGAKDKIRIDGGRMERSKNKGLVMGLIANIPNFLLGFLTVLFLLIFMATNNDGVYTAFLIFQMITRFNAAMYLGFIIEIVPPIAPTGNISYMEFLIESILFMVLPIISPLVTHFAYRMGEQDKKIFAIRKNKQ